MERAREDKRGSMDVAAWTLTLTLLGRGGWGEWFWKGKGLGRSHS